MNNDGQKVKDIIDQLQRLQIEQTALLTRLEQATEGATRTSENDDAPPARAGSTTRELAIGDRVIVRNPRRLQITKGTIIKINLLTDRYTVRDSNGLLPVVRSRNNLIRDEQR